MIGSNHTIPQFSQLLRLRQGLGPERNNLREVGRTGFDDQVDEIARISDSNVGHHRVRTVRKFESIGTRFVLSRDLQREYSAIPSPFMPGWKAVLL